MLYAGSKCYNTLWPTLYEAEKLGFMKTFFGLFKFQREHYCETWKLFPRVCLIGRKLSSRRYRVPLPIWPFPDTNLCCSDNKSLWLRLLLRKIPKLLGKTSCFVTVRLKLSYIMEETWRIKKGPSSLKLKSIEPARD